MSCQKNINICLKNLYLRNSEEHTLNKHIKLLKECQESKSINSCLKCLGCVECTLRQDYVYTVYKSMNSNMNSNTGFEF